MSVKRDFLKSLYDEKMIHKEHRHKLLKQKMAFMVGLLGIGSLKTSNLCNTKLQLFQILYIAPFIMLAFDLYLFSEDFKVKRVGDFLSTQKSLCKIELAWEKWLMNGHREPLAAWTSFFITLLAFIWAIINLCPQNEKVLNVFWGKYYVNFKIWLGLVVTCKIFVFSYGRTVRKRLAKK